MNPRTENELRALTADPHLGGVYARPSWTDVEHLLSKLAQLRTENERLREALKPMVLSESDKQEAADDAQALGWSDDRYAVCILETEIEAAAKEERRCLNCNEVLTLNGHFTPPSLGEPGFYICELANELHQRIIRGPDQFGDYPCDRLTRGRYPTSPY